jgi:hypothetical protein
VATSICANEKGSRTNPEAFLIYRCEQRTHLFVRVAMCVLAVFVGVVTMFLSRRSVLLPAIMIAMIVFMSSLQVVVSSSLMLSGSIVVMLAGGVLLLFIHVKSPS